MFLPRSFLKRASRISRDTCFGAVARVAQSGQKDTWGSKESQPGQPRLQNPTRPNAQPGQAPRDPAPDPSATCLCDPNSKHLSLERGRGVPGPCYLAFQVTIPTCTSVPDERTTSRPRPLGTLQAESTSSYRCHMFESAEAFHLTWKATGLLL